MPQPVFAGSRLALQLSDGQCICRSGYEYYNEGGVLVSNVDGAIDCQPIVYERCYTGEALDADGICVSERWEVGTKAENATLTRMYTLGGHVDHTWSRARVSVSRHSCRVCGNTAIPSLMVAIHSHGSFQSNFEYEFASHSRNRLTL